MTALNINVTAQMVRPGDATQYAVGDLIGNSQTAASVVPIDFVVARSGPAAMGHITGARCVITAASGTIVLPRFDLLLFRPVTDIPFAAGSYPADNTALQVAAAAMKEMIGVLTFDEGRWRNRDGGASAAGTHVWQSVAPTPRALLPFNLNGASSRGLRGLLQAQNTWNPGNVQNTFDFVLDVEAR